MGDEEKSKDWRLKVSFIKTSQCLFYLKDLKNVFRALGHIFSWKVHCSSSMPQPVFVVLSESSSKLTIRCNLRLYLFGTMLIIILYCTIHIVLSLWSIANTEYTHSKDLYERQPETSQINTDTNISGKFPDKNIWTKNILIKWKYILFPCPCLYAGYSALLLLPFIVYGAHLKTKLFKRSFLLERKFKEKNVNGKLLFRAESSLEAKINFIFPQKLFSLSLEHHSDSTLHKFWINYLSNENLTKSQVIAHLKPGK